MSLGPFTTHLIPFSKNGKLQFWNDITKEIIEADFSRPNVGGTSGSSVWRNNQLIELAEDEPDWDDRDGCPRLLVRPQASSIVTNSSPSSSSWTKRGAVTVTAGALPFGDVSLDLIENLGVVNVDDFILSLSGLAPSSRYEPSFLFNKNGNSGTIQLRSTVTSSLGVWTIDLDLLPNTTIEIDRYTNGVTITSEFGSNSSGSFGLQFVSNSGPKNVFIGGVTACLGAIPQGIIPNTGTALTRSANSASFTDLVTKSVFSSTSWSVLMEIDNMQAGGATGAFIFFNGSGLDMYFRAITNTSFNFWNQEGQVSIGNTAVASVSDNHKFIVTYDNGVLNIYLNGARVVTDYSYVFNITSIAFSANFSGFTCSYKYKNLRFAPFALTESQAIAELNKL